MAESQVAYPYDPAGIAALRASISAPRFGPYLSMAGRDERYALALYLYNARLAKSFLYPLHMAEVTLRNAIVDALATEFGPDWPSDGAFRAMLTPGGTATLDKARERVTADKGPNFPVSQLVATLTFDFWSNLFRPHYYLPFWQRHLRNVLPHLPAGEGRHEAQARVREINRFRNRIAHHEPILKADATATHKGILDLVATRCPTTSAWLKHHSTLHAIIRGRPRNAGASGQSVGEVCDPAFAPVAAADSLASALAVFPSGALAFVVHDDAGRPTLALRPDDVLRFVAARAAELGGMIDLNAHAMADVASGVPPRSCAVHDCDDPLHRAAATLRKDGVRLVLVTETRVAGVVAKGVLLRAHRRY